MRFPFAAAVQPTSTNVQITDGERLRAETGRAFWGKLHAWASNYNTSMGDGVVDMITSWLSGLSCTECWQHGTQYVMQNAPPVNGDAYKMSQWAWRWHNQVNSHLGKPQYPWDSVVMTLGPFRPPAPMNPVPLPSSPEPDTRPNIGGVPVYGFTENAPVIPTPTAPGTFIPPPESIVRDESQIATQNRGNNGGIRTTTGTVKVSDLVNGNTDTPAIPSGTSGKFNGGGGTFWSQLTKQAQGV